MFQNMAIKFCRKKFKILIFKIAIEERKLNLLRKKFNNMPLHSLVIDFLKKKIENQTFFFNLRVLYMEIYTLKAYNSAKKKQMTEIFSDVNQGTRYYRFMKKTEVENLMLLSL